MSTRLESDPAWAARSSADAQDLDVDIHFGGPGRRRRWLRDLLEARVAAVPPGGTIDWVTYYFRDRRLADALVAAQRRGVSVTVTIEGQPRTPDANQLVSARLARGLGAGFREITSPLDDLPLNKLLRPRLHEKLYCFSHPRPTALLGSFNPSGDAPEEHPDVIRQIGDQDIASNLLLEINDPRMVTGLIRHARRLHRMRHGLHNRLTPGLTRVLRTDQLAVHFTPALHHRAPAMAALAELGASAKVRIAASHLSGSLTLRCLGALARRGAEIEVIAETTTRRIPLEIEAALRARGIVVRRAVHPANVPMHDKFVLIDVHGSRQAILGSFNWTTPSLRYNREITAFCRHELLLDALDARWTELRQRCVDPSPAPASRPPTG